MQTRAQQTGMRESISCISSLESSSGLQIDVSIHRLGHPDRTKDLYGTDGAFLVFLRRFQPRIARMTRIGISRQLRELRQRSRSSRNWRLIPSAVTDTASSSD